MGKRSLVAVVVTSVLALDVATKQVVRRTMDVGESFPVAGDALRLTYVLNPGAAFGLSFGPASRWVFAGLAVMAGAAIVWMIRDTRPRERARLVALALILAGALGNLLDRLRDARGVVDFLDVGFGTLRWPIFNVADVAVTSGALLLVLLLAGEGRVEAGGS